MHKKGHIDDLDMNLLDESSHFPADNGEPVCSSRNTKLSSARERGGGCSGRGRLTSAEARQQDGKVKQSSNSQRSGVSTQKKRNSLRSVCRYAYNTLTLSCSKSSPIFFNTSLFKRSRERKKEKGR